MKNILFILVFFIAASYNAQQVYPLNADFDEIPQNSYLKDIDNELDAYVGNYFASYNGKYIKLFITKELKRYFDHKSVKIYSDVLSVKYIVKNSSGITLQDTKTIDFQPNQIKNTIYSIGTRPLQNSVGLIYGGTNCGVGNGLINLKKLNSSQISWEYFPNDIILDSERCPSGTDTTIYLPETMNLIFTKM